MGLLTRIWLALGSYSKPFTSSAVSYFYMTRQAGKINTFVYSHLISCPRYLRRRNVLFVGNELDSLLCVPMSVCVVSEDAGSPAASVSECSGINWGLFSYLGPTAVPETEESDEALFCRVWVAAGAVCAGWVWTKRNPNMQITRTHACTVIHTCTSHVWNDADTPGCFASCNIWRRN